MNERAFSGFKLFCWRILEQCICVYNNPLYAEAINILNSSKMTVNGELFKKVINPRNCAILN